MSNETETEQDETGTTHTVAMPPTPDYVRQGPLTPAELAKQAVEVAAVINKRKRPVFASSGTPGLRGHFGTPPRALRGRGGMMRRGFRVKTIMAKREPASEILAYADAEGLGWDELHAMAQRNASSAVR